MNVKKKKSNDEVMGTGSSGDDTKSSTCSDVSNIDEQTTHSTKDDDAPLEEEGEEENSLGLLAANDTQNDGLLPQSDKKSSIIRGTNITQPIGATYDLRAMTDDITISTGNNSLFLDGDDNEFELMMIRVTVIRLTGILCERDDKRRSRAKSLTARYNVCKSIKSGTTPTISSSSEDTSLWRSTVDSSQSNHSVSVGTPPFTEMQAVIAFKRNVCNSATSISSHLPSNIIYRPFSSFGYVERYAASWPAERASTSLDEDDWDLVEQSTFELQRVMMKECFRPDSSPFSRMTTFSNMSNYAHETIDLQVHLKSGNEMIPIGVASLGICGDEEGARTMNVPVRPIYFKGKKMVVHDKSIGKRKKKKNLFSKSTRKPSFPRYPSVKYSLDENASLKIILQVMPHGIIKETAAAKARRLKRQGARNHGKENRNKGNSERNHKDDITEEEDETELESITEGSCLLDDTESTISHDSKQNEEEEDDIGEVEEEAEDDGVDKSEQNPPLTPKNAGLFCGDMCATQSTNRDPFKKVDKKMPPPPFKKKVQFREDSFGSSNGSSSRSDSSYRYPSGPSPRSYASSVLSSISESESESDSSDDEGGHINRNITVYTRD